jgi:hAT family C-terminal dimerisation region
MVKINRHNVYTLIYKLINLGLILPIATANIERVFSTMNLVKTDTSSSMRYKWMNDYLIIFIEKKNSIPWIIKGL